MDYLVRYISTAVPAASELSVAYYYCYYFSFHNGHTDLDVASGDLDCLCLYQNVMHIRHCEYKWRTQLFSRRKKTTLHIFY